MAERGGRSHRTSSPPQQADEPSARNRLLAYGFVSCVAFAVYANTLSAGFVYDDSRAILKNRDLLPETPISNLLFNDFWGTPLVHSGSHRSYRPLCVLSFRLNYAVSGVASGFSYHLVNVLLHAAVSSLFMLVCTLLLPKNTAGFQVAFLASILFAVHPVHTEAVAGLVGRADVGSALFFLLAFAFFHRILKHSQAPTGQTLLLYVSVLVSTAMAMLTKEIGITVLGVCVLYDALVNESILQLPSLLHIFKKKGLIMRCFALFLGGLLLLAWRVSVMGGQAPSFSSSDNPAASSNSTLTRFLTFSHLPALNAILLLCPRALSFDWSMDAVPLVEGLGDARNTITLIFYAVLLALAYMAIVGNTGRWKAHSSLTVSILLAALPFIPASNLFFYVGFVLAERVLYIPSMGYCLLVAVGMQRVRNLSFMKAHRSMFTACIAVVLLALSMRTWQRNADWQNEESLYRSGIPYNPAKAWGNLANILKGKGDTHGAVDAYRNALKHRSNMADAHYNLGVTLQDLKDFPGAGRSYRNAIECRPSLALAHLNLGIVLRTVQNTSEAEKVLLHCTTIPDTGLKDPTGHNTAVTSCMFTLGQLYQDQQRQKDALAMLEKALGHAPPGYEIQSIYNLLGGAHAKLGQLKLAEANYRKSLQAKPDHLPAIVSFAQFLAEQKRVDDAEAVYKSVPGNPTARTYYGVLLCNQPKRRLEGAAMMEQVLKQSQQTSNPELLVALSDCYRRAEKYDKAITFYKEVTRIQPTETAFSNLGAVYHLLNKYAEAADAYRRALDINPSSSLVKANLQKLEKLQKRSS